MKLLIAALAASIAAAPIASADDQSLLDRNQSFLDRAHELGVPSQYGFLGRADDNSTLYRGLEICRNLRDGMTLEQMEPKPSGSPILDASPMFYWEIAQAAQQKICPDTLGVPSERPNT
ncbi:DUF732 domain-containing protein [Mycolicibacter longobardus]|uniref:DUF732 domain-containing protein n=1 Tax=Mycolicibacter longobardus TaxID=1108812 RepID=UPI000A148571|nr:DUF732 domain-containing protein [Mycolicibacter longobardus]MCV7384393.1 DUF732 domain-containing protein [Mycolicibacter longobardus]